ncbi:YSIRK-type signal peptide-containing protein [Lactobacillus mulieris]|uniref:YSIRK-type signal peptide-containing protein n=1 Tax=Lactobacillus mulieris TaxID=2508708 RepID=UPI002244CED6|nr:YSIRK-type signal peptide-containing protein [Lactobacillus mulieris]MCW8103989.1 YSIRK-type signal peptide-containing protein [Lactobacillus mulieris]
MGVSRNNFKNKMKQMAEQKPRFGFRKFSVGLASALIATVFYFGAMPSSVKADVQTETETDTKTVSQIDQQDKKTNNQNSSKTANMSNQQVTSINATTTTQNENGGGRPSC